MSKVFLVDSQRKPLDPIHPGWARRLLSSGQAAVLRRYPFTLILKKSVEEPSVQTLRIKLDPGSRTTGVAILNDQSGAVVFAAELSHRGHQIKKALDGRRGVRKSRRARHSRYRQARWATGTYTGRMAAKASGYFTISTNLGTITDIGHTYCRRLHKADGYGYQSKGERHFSPT